MFYFSPLYEFVCLFFFFNDTATTEIYTLSLHDALPIWAGDDDDSVLEAGDLLQDFRQVEVAELRWARRDDAHDDGVRAALDRKSTRLNSSHSQISYAVFCLKKKTIGSEYPLCPTAIGPS